MRKFYIKAEIKKTKNRNLKILPSHISKTIQVYNGKTFVNVFGKIEIFTFVQLFNTSFSIRRSILLT